MVNKLRLDLLCVASLTLWSSWLSAAPVSSELKGALQVREQHLNHLSLDCQLLYKEVDAADTPEEIMQKQRSLKEELPNELRRAGITDEVSIQQQVQSSVDHVAQAGKAAIFHSTTPCHFERYDDQALVVGVRELADDRGMSSQSYRYFYNNDSAILINDENVINDKRYPSHGASAWKTSGKSIYYRSPDPEGLGLLPEHLVMILGVNPLATHGAQWELVSETPSAFQLHCKVVADNLLPLDIQMTLDRLHGDAPSEMRVAVAGDKELITLNARSYKLFNGEWISDKVECHKHFATFDISQVWSVQSVTASKPIAVTVPASMFVRDYRLLGDQIGNLMMPTGKEKKSIVTYRWPGHLPTLEELKKIQNQQNPGESAPDPGKTSSALPFLGGLLCLIGGVWMFKRRGVS